MKQLLAIPILIISLNLVRIPPIYDGRDIEPVETIGTVKAVKYAPVAEMALEIPLKPMDVPSGPIQDYIIKMAGEYGLSAERMLRVAKCESGFDPSNVNYGYYAGGGNPSGLYQYLPETWTRIAGRSPYGVGDVFNYIDNVNVTMWAWANGYSGEWACQ